MQVLKEEIRKKIIDIARKNFMDKGYRKTTMNDISSGVGIRTSTIYCYFRDKESLFAYIVRPATDYFSQEKQRIERMNPSEHSSWSLKSRKAAYEDQMEFINRNKDEFKMLFSCAEGSSLEYYSDSLVFQYETLMRKMTEGSEEAGISDLFIHIMAVFYVSIIKEISVNNIEEEEVKRFSEEWATFRTWGLKGITQSG